MNEIQKYFKYRQNLIDQYVMGDMTKAEYLQYNLDAVLNLNIKPFKNIDTIEKGLFNYQYFNALAKDSSVQSKSIKNKEHKEKLIKQSDYYYTNKDNASITILHLLDYKNISAYFIKVRSKFLKDILFEIILEDCGIILHSTSSYILATLRREHVFSEEIRFSIIDNYINQKY